MVGAPRQPRRWPVRVAVYGTLALGLAVVLTFPWSRRETPVTNAPSVVVRAHVGLLHQACSIASEVHGVERSIEIDCDATTSAYPSQSIPAVGVHERARDRWSVLDPRRGALVHRGPMPLQALGIDGRIFVAEAIRRDADHHRPGDWRYVEIAADGSERDATCAYQDEAFTCLTEDGRLISALWWAVEAPTIGPPNDVPSADRIERITGCAPRLIAVVHLRSGGERMLAFDRDGVLRWSHPVRSPSTVIADADCRRRGAISLMEDDGIETLDVATGAVIPPSAAITP